GEFLSILGSSGSGKTTLLRSIAGLSQPYCGRIYVDNRLVCDQGKEIVPTEKRQVGLVFQDYALFPHLSVYNNIAFGLKQDKKTCQRRVDELLGIMGMRVFAQCKPYALSGGQQQRVALARALAPRPKLLLLDEPFANVDANLRQALGEELQILVRSQGVSVILVTHNRNQALALADRVIVLAAKQKQGASIVQVDTPEMVYHRPSDQRVAEITGPASFIPATATGNTAQTAYGDIELLAAIRGEGQLLLRPEMVQFNENKQGHAEVIARLFLGHTYRLLCKTAHGNLFAYGQRPIALGARGDIEIKPPCWFLGG
ncbi:MAG: ABC transporter ATP-binding protein, partial [Gammaproteobacteria bacterium]